MITQLTLKNFTVFNDLSIDFSAKINVIIGENGTGKSHLLKAAYALCSANNGLNGQEDVSDKEIKEGLSPIFIPTKELLTFLRGFGNIEVDANVLKLMFDETYFDLAAKLLNDAGQEPREKEEWLLENLVNKMEGRFSLDAGEMSFQPGTYIEYADGKAKDGKLTYFSPQRKDVFSPNMMAEGFRKFGVLQRLLQNCSLVPGVTGSLFWDEPESNLNPQLMKLLVQTMLELSRSGQQIILATHDYVLLKWFDLLVNTDAGDHIRFHSLSRENGDVRVQSADDYRQLNSNAIANTFSDLYDEEIKRSLGGA